MNKRRYNMYLPEELHNEIEKIADESGISIMEVFRKFIRLGLIASKIANTPGTALLIRDAKGAEREIIFV